IPLFGGGSHDGRGWRMVGGRWRPGVHECFQPRRTRGRRPMGGSHQRWRRRPDLCRAGSRRGRLCLHSRALPRDILMCEFLIRTQPPGAPIVVTTPLAYEGVEYILRQTFPPHTSAPSFVMGISGPQLGSREERPNEANSIGYDEQMTFAQVTGQDANEGG